MNRATYALGIDLGASNIKLVAVTPEGELLHQCAAATVECDLVSQVRTQLDEVEQRLGLPPTAAGLAAPGLAAPDGRSIAWMRGRLEAVQGLHWTEALNYGLLVPVLNDAHAALLGEVWRGAAAGCRNAILLTLGTGVGGGVLVDGRLLQGHIGRAGHLGHIALNVDGSRDIVGTPGSLEDAIGDCTVSARSGGRFATTSDLVEAYRRGQAEASQVWLRSLWHLACGIISIVNVVDPEVVILGGGIAAAGDALFVPLQQYLDQLEWRPTGSAVRLVQAALGEHAGAYGAAYHALKTRGQA